VDVAGVEVDDRLEPHGDLVAFEGTDVVCEIANLWLPEFGGVTCQVGDVCTARVCDDGVSLDDLLRSSGFCFARAV
jgi:hypothetical protein